MAASICNQGLCHKRSVEEGNREGWCGHQACHHQDYDTQKVNEAKSRLVFLKKFFLDSDSHDGAIWFSVCITNNYIILVIVKCKSSSYSSRSILEMLFSVMICFPVSGWIVISPRTDLPVKYVMLPFIWRGRAKREAWREGAEV